MKIGIVDSGLGGLVVLKELLKQQKTAHYIYYGDFKHSPYGNKNDMQLRRYFQTAMSFFLKKQCDQVLIACNTLSTIVEPIAENCFTPVFGVKKKMREITSSKMVVLATKKTIQSHLYEQPNCIGIACPKFVKYLENNPNHDCKKAIHHYLKKHQDAQTLVLGCTHYQLLKEEIVRYFQHPIKIIDSSEEIANQLSIKNSSLQIDLYVTKINDKIKKNIAIILQGFTYQIHLLDEPIH